MNKSSRRKFLTRASVGSAMALTIPQIVSSAFTVKKEKQIRLKQGDVILFQGDSITDAGRKRDDNGKNNDSVLGNGYPVLAGAELLYQYADKQLSVYNKGISGNKVYQLADRWEEDCLALKPNVLSILIGVNDFWHKFNHNYDGTLQVYKDDFTALLERTKKALPNVQFIIGEPFGVRGISAVKDEWYPDFDGYRQAAREVADAFGAIFIPYQKVFDEAQKTAPGSYWTHDGVHPSLAGAQLMAHAWLKTVKG